MQTNSVFIRWRNGLPVQVIFVIYVFNMKFKYDTRIHNFKANLCFLRFILFRAFCFIIIWRWQLFSQFQLFVDHGLDASRNPIVSLFFQIISNVLSQSLLSFQSNRRQIQPGASNKKLYLILNSKFWKYPNKFINKNHWRSRNYI